jgi:putative transposase
MFFLLKVKRSHVAVWNWIQKCHHEWKSSSKKRRTIEEFIVDEALLKVGLELIWLWISIEPKNRQILTQTITEERTMLIAERFLSGVVCQRLWKTSCIHRRWRYMVPDGL